MWIIEGRESTNARWFYVNCFGLRPDAMRDWKMVTKLHPSNEYRVRLDSKGFNDAILYS